MAVVLAAALEALPDPGITQAAATALAQADGMVEEYRAWALPWGFDFADVRVPTTVWQGTADHLVPESWGRAYAARIPGARLELREGEGHFLGYRHVRDVLGGL